MPAMEVFENKLTEWAKGRRRRFASIDELTEEYQAVARDRRAGSRASTS